MKKLSASYAGLVLLAFFNAMFELASDTASFVAYARPDSASRFTARNDSLVGAGATDFTGRSAKSRLVPIRASQEFWHSWRTVQPRTRKHDGA